MKKCQVALNLPKQVQNLPHFLTIPPKVTKELLFHRQNKEFFAKSGHTVGNEHQQRRCNVLRYSSNVNLHFRYKQDTVGSQRLQPAAVIFIHLTITQLRKTLPTSPKKQKGYKVVTSHLPQPLTGQLQSRPVKQMVKLVYLLYDYV